MRLVILDRDGVINHDSPDFIRSAGEWRPIPGSLEAIATLTQAGVTIAVATNQSGIGRGLFDMPTLEAIHARMLEKVEAAGGRIETIAICPHRPDEGCDCRKPGTGMLEQIAARLGASLTGVPFIGDSKRDIEAARAADARPILVLTGDGRRTAASLDPVQMPEVFDDLAAAAKSLIREARD